MIGHITYFGNRYLGPNVIRLNAVRQLMDQDPYVLDAASRKIVLEAIQEVCRRRSWRLIAAHVRTNHVHAVVEADRRPEAVMHDFKAYASRLLNACRKEPPETKRWTRHGSTRYLWKDEEVAKAVAYVLEQQGEPMAVFPLLEPRSAP